jgi:6-phosphogluconolactonase
MIHSMEPVFCRLGLVLAAMLIVGMSTVAVVQAGEPAAAHSEKIWVYVGTYTWRESKGIHLLELDRTSGELKYLGLAVETASPSFVVHHPTRPLVFAVGEISEFAGKKSGAVSAFSRDPATGKLTLINQQPTGGPGPCHVAIDRSGRWVLVANYSGGSVACLPVQEQGDLGPATSFHQHLGSGTDPKRQSGPHAHAITLDPKNHFALVPDLGLDKLMIYRFDADLGQLEANSPAFAALPPGAGPRHVAFHTTGQFVYAISEMASTITAFAYDSTKGVLTPIDTVSTLPGDFKGDNTTAEIAVHPSGRFLYGSNRGHNSIAAFAIDHASGKLSPLGWQSTEGKTPRNFVISPGGRFLLAANQDSGTVVVLRIDPQTGRLEPTGHKVDVPLPVCLEMLPAPKAQP